MFNCRAKVPFGEKFYDFMDNKITALLKQEADITPTPQINVIWSWSKNFYEPGEISRINLDLHLQSHSIGHPISFCWRSKSGEPISISDEDFDEDNLEYWLEGVDAEKFHEELAQAKKAAPFRIGRLPFELEIRDYEYSMHVYVTLSDKEIFEEVSTHLDKTLSDFNKLAYAREFGEKKGKPLQGLHNWKITETEDGRMQLYLDAASPEVLKKILKELTKFKPVTKVEMDLVS
ncbi:hypothetical protein A9P82_02415 [Arachidicoccus ginsenosidimutans]|nr:hypothetical protein A9P82_02415 [Arachidicoccus sp. BS20]